MILEVFYFFGVYSVLCYSIQHLRLLLVGVWSVLTSEKRSLVEKYGQWAVVTGGSDGIGKQFAYELAKLGHNIVILSNAEEDLVKVLAEIERLHAVKVKYIVVDFSAGREVYETIKSQLASLNIGVLVNNVGAFHEFPRNFDSISEEAVWRLTNINISAVTMMSRVLVPQMKANRRGLIVNIASGSAYQPTPWMTLYASQKTYVRNFTLALREELREENVDVQLISPMFVKTRINSYSTSLYEENFLVPDAEAFAKSAVLTFGRAAETSGYWSHELYYALIKLVPEVVRTHFGFRLMKKFNGEYCEQLKHSSN